MVRMVAWAPKDQSTIGAIEAPHGMVMLKTDYLIHLGFRLKALAQQASPDELEQASEILIRAGLMEVPIDQDQAGSMLLWENFEVKHRLAELGIPGRMTWRVMGVDQAAAESISNVTLLDWANELAYPLIERD